MTQRSDTLRDIAREYLRAKSASLQEQLETSVWVERVIAESEQQKQEPTNVEPMGVVDRQRGWRLT